jgi:hypothetical protein
MFKHSHWLIIWYAIILHFVWAITLAFSPTAGYATAVHTMLEFISVPWAITLYGVVAFMATIGLYCRHGFGRVIALLPQQFVLMVSAGGALWAMYLGQFADGVQRSHEFLIADQSPAVIGAILHTVAIYWIINRAKKHE